jgi:hypothetical protein
MANSLDRVTLFSSYDWSRGGELARQLSGYTAFSTQETRTPTYSYDVNTVDQYIPTGYIGLDSKHRLTQSNTTSSYNDNLSIANNNTGRLTTNATVGATPEIPEQYNDRVNYYGVTDAQFDTLMQQSEFVIPRVGSGLKVTTDGQGNVANVAVSPSSVGMLTAYGSVPLPNFAELTAGAVPKVDSTDSPYATNTLKPGEARRMGLPQNTGVIQQRPNTIKPPVQSLLSKQAGGATNPIEDRLNSLFGATQSRLNAPANQGLSISGQDSQLNFQQARQIAAVQANFDVPTTPGFRQTLAQLASSNQAGQTTTSVMPAITPMATLMDGKVAMTPQVSVTNPFANQRAASGSRVDMAESFMDASERRSKGGYLPPRFMGDTTANQQQQMSSGSGSGMTFSQGGANTNGQAMSDEQRKRNTRQTPWGMTA